MYNTYLGGTDINTCFIAYYCKSLSLCLCSFPRLSYNKQLGFVNERLRSSDIPKRAHMSLLEFRLYIAEVLIKSENEHEPAVGRPRKLKQSPNENTVNQKESNHFEVHYGVIPHQTNQWTKLCFLNDCAYCHKIDYFKEALMEY